MKKVLTVLLCFMLSLALFAGGSRESTTAESAADNGKTKLEFWTWLSSDAAIDAYNQMQDDVEIVKVQMSHADINAKLAIALQAGTGAPDIYQTTQRYYPQFRDSGHMYDMTSVVSDIMDGYPDSLKDLVTYNGQIAGLTPDVSPSVMFYRADIFEEYGIEIETFNDLIEAAKILKEDGIYMLPIFNPAGSWGANAVGMLLGSRGGNYFTADGKVIHDNKDLEIVLEFLNTMVAEGYGESLTFFTPEFWGEFKAGKIAAWIMNTAEAANLKTNAPELSGKWKIMPTPRWDDKEQALSGYWGGTVIAVTDQSENPGAAADFVKWLCGSVEGQVWAGKTWSAVPAYEPAYSDPFYQEGDPYFSGDNIYDMILDTTPFHYFDWASVEMIIGEKLDLMFAGQLTPQEAARAIEDTIAAETGR